MSSTPFDYLAELSSDILTRNPQLPFEEEIKQTWSGVGFSLLGHRMVAPLGEIVEMIPPPNTTKLPGVQPWIIGLANVRGRLLPLFDLEIFLGGKLLSNRNKHRVLILEMGELYAGLVVSEAYGMQHFPVDLAASEIPEAITHLKDYTLGAYEAGDYTWSVFSPYRLISDPKFFNAAAL